MSRGIYLTVVMLLHRQIKKEWPSSRDPSMVQALKTLIPTFPTMQLFLRPFPRLADAHVFQTPDPPYLTGPKMDPCGTPSVRSRILSTVMSSKLNCNMDKTTCRTEAFSKCNFPSQSRHVWNLSEEKQMGVCTSWVLIFYISIYK